MFMVNILFKINKIFTINNKRHFGKPHLSRNHRRKKTPFGALPIFGKLRALMHHPEHLDFILFKTVGGDEGIARNDYLSNPWFRRRTPHPGESLQEL
jgi:hypothetical protein